MVCGKNFELRGSMQDKTLLSHKDGPGVPAQLSAGKPNYLDVIEHPSMGLLYI